MSAIIHAGDCLEIMAGIPDCSIDAVIADPPYGTTACKWDSVIPFAPMWEQLKRLAKPRAAIVLFGSQPFTSALVMSNPAMFRYEWVWEKSISAGFMHAKHAPMKAHENVIVFGAMTPRYFPQMDSGAPYSDGSRRRTLGIYGEETSKSLKTKSAISNSGTRYPKSVRRFPNPNNGIAHPTQKPVPLLEYLIRTYTNEGDTVLDFCAGSGSTGVAAITTGRNFIGIEREPQYVAVARQRIAAAEASRQPALFAAD